ncbi:MAG: FkbM family methyltransferase [Verrucomicrobia bacterium]|nr:FkbM family methyltransferase [Verrucomicrobiota bacterium]
MIRQLPTSSLARLHWSGRDLLYRSGTRDPFVLYQVLLRSGKKAEYYLPRTVRPKIILDIGSNIGASIVYFHRRFPDAKIFGFEPHPDTFRILKENVGGLRGVAVFNYGLGATDQRIAVRADNVRFGGFTTHGSFRDRGRPATIVECEVRRLDHVLGETGIAKVDLIKIDCEGAEADVFSTLPDEILNHCQWIVGEFHDHTGFEVLARLAPHFHLDLKKKMFRRQFRFHACNISKMLELSRSDLDALQH